MIVIKKTTISLKTGKVISQEIIGPAGVASQVKNSAVKIVRSTTRTGFERHL